MQEGKPSGSEMGGEMKSEKRGGCFLLDIGVGGGGDEVEFTCAFERCTSRCAEMDTSAVLSTIGRNNSQCKTRAPATK